MKGFKTEISRNPSSGEIIPISGPQANHNVRNGSSMNGRPANIQPPSGTIQDQFVTQGTFSTLQRHNSYIAPSSQQFPQMYNMSQTATVPPPQQNGNNTSLPPRGMGDSFTQAEFQPIRSNSMPAYPPEIQNYQAIQQQQQQQQLPPQALPPQQQQQQQPPPPQHHKFYQNAMLPNTIPQQVFYQGKPLSSQSSNDSSWSVGNNPKESDTSANSSTDDPKQIQQQQQEEDSSPQGDNSYAAQLLRFSVMIMQQFHILSSIHLLILISMNQLTTRAIPRYIGQLQLVIMK